MKAPGEAWQETSILRSCAAKGTFLMVFRQKGSLVLPRGSITYLPCHSRALLLLPGILGCIGKSTVQLISFFCAARGGGVGAVRTKHADNVEVPKLLRAFAMIDAYGN